jgi:hypothetical protein
MRGARRWRTACQDSENGRLVRFTQKISIEVVTTAESAIANVVSYAPDERRLV